MTKSATNKTYSLEEVHKVLEKNLENSARRLASRLKLDWKKQAPLKERVYDKNKI